MLLQVTVSKYIMIGKDRHHMYGERLAKNEVADRLSTEGKKEEDRAEQERGPREPSNLRSEGLSERESPTLP